MSLPPQGNPSGASALPAVPLISLAETLKCPHCSKIYVNPVMLDCSHSICLACARDLAREGGPQQVFGAVQCPSCRHITAAEGVDQARHMEGSLIANALGRFSIPSPPSNPRMEVITLFTNYLLTTNFTRITTITIQTYAMVKRQPSRTLFLFR